MFRVLLHWLDAGNVADEYLGRLVHCVGFLVDGAVGLMAVPERGLVCC